MSKAFDEYTILLESLNRVRTLHHGAESPEEDKLLDDMDAVWLLLTDEERTKFQEIPSK